VCGDRIFDLSAKSREDTRAKRSARALQCVRQPCDSGGILSLLDHSETRNAQRSFLQEHFDELSEGVLTQIVQWLQDLSID
jgi:hypothetical protein